MVFKGPLAVGRRTSWQVSKGPGSLLLPSPGVILKAGGTWSERGKEEIQKEVGQK